MEPLNLPPPAKMCRLDEAAVAPAPTTSTDNATESSASSSSSTGSRQSTSAGSAPRSPLLEYGYLRSMMRLLPTTALHTCAQVCTVWKAAAVATNKDQDRCRPIVFTWVASKERKKERQKFGYYGKFPIFCSPDHEDLESALSTFVREKLTWRPAAAVGFLSGSDRNDEVVSPQSAFVASAAKLGKLLPDGCVFASIVCGGIVATDLSTGVPFETENTFATQPIVTIVFLPAHPNVSVMPARVPKNDPRVPEFRSDPLSSAEFTEIWSVACAADPTAEIRSSAAAIVLGSFHLQQYYDMASDLPGLLNGNIAVGGVIGYHPEVISSGESSSAAAAEDAASALPDSMLVGGLLLRGNGLAAASVVLHKEIRTEEKIAEVLADLRLDGVDEARTCAFMFACCGRGKAFHKRKANVESAIFHRMYPRTPLAGVFGYGEIGWDSRCAAGADLREDLFHGYTTIFVRIAYKN